MNKKTKVGLITGALAMAICATPVLAGCGGDEEKIKDLNSQIETLQSQNETLTTERNTYKSTSETQASQITTLQSTNTTQASQITALESQMTALNEVINITFKDLFYNVADLQISQEPGKISVGFDQLVDIGNSVYLVLNDNELNYGDVYKVIIEDENNSSELIFKLGYANGKYFVYYKGMDGDTPKADAYSFAYNKGKLTEFVILKNGIVSHTSESIVDNFCSNEIPSISFGEPTIVYERDQILAELTAEIPEDHVITIAKADKDALDAELNS